MQSVRREGGAIEWTYPAGRTVTCSTFTCCHCNTVTIVEQSARAEDCGGFCLRCMEPTCKACATNGCTPFERELERMEARGRLRRSMGI